MPSTHRADSAPDRAPWSPQPRYGPPLRSRYWFTVNLILAQPNFPVLKKIIPCSLEKIPCRNFREFFASHWFVTSFRAVVAHVRGQSSDFPCFFGAVPYVCGAVATLNSCRQGYTRQSQLPRIGKPAMAQLVHQGRRSPCSSLVGGLVGGRGFEPPTPRLPALYSRSIILAILQAVS